MSKNKKSVRIHGGGQRGGRRATGFGWKNGGCKEINRSYSADNIENHAKTKNTRLAE